MNSQHLQVPHGIDDAQCLSAPCSDRDLLTCSPAETLQQLCHQRCLAPTPAHGPAGPRHDTRAAAGLQAVYASIPFVSAAAKRTVQLLASLGLLEYDADAQRVSVPRYVAAALQSSLDASALSAAAATAMSAVVHFCSNKLALAAALAATAPQAALGAVDRDFALVSRLLEWTHTAAETGVSVPVLLLPCWEGFPLLKHRLGREELTAWLRHCAAIARVTPSRRLSMQVCADPDTHASLSLPPFSLPHLLPRPLHRSTAASCSIRASADSRRAGTRS